MNENLIYRALGLLLEDQVRCICQMASFKCSRCGMLEQLAQAASASSKMRIEERIDKSTGEHTVDFPDCPEPYRTMLRRLSSTAQTVGGVDEKA